jgi:hypothetical protein
MEGKYNPTFAANKPMLLLHNHPGAKMIMFYKSSHAIFADEPSKFFDSLRRFVHEIKYK